MANYDNIWLAVAGGGFGFSAIGVLTVSTNKVIDKNKTFGIGLSVMKNHSGVKQ